jgi:DNA-binding MarR family transcriptional regulator
MGIVQDIERSAHLIGRHIERAAARLDVTQAEAHVLVQLHRGGAQTVGELQRGFGHKRSTLTSVLDRLDLRGFVDRRVNPHDRRSYIVALTRSGLDAAREVNAVVESLERTIRRRVTARDLEGVRAVAAALGASAEGQSTPSEASKETRSVTSP